MWAVLPRSRVIPPGKMLPDPRLRKASRPSATKVEVLRSQECWFAVSGTYVALGDYSDTFPKPTSGKSIATGEKFDTVGGVFLAARAEPYVYKAGGGEIDGAVATVLNLRIKQNLMRAVSHTGPSGCGIICACIGKVQLIPMQAARWVKVFVVEGGRCTP